MQRIKKIAAIILAIATLSSVCVFGSTFSAGARGTGAGLAEWALNAYYSKWSYVYGGATPGAVDCSGLIYSYCGGARVGMLDVATEKGSVSAGIPRVHGLGLWMPGHVGVYVGDGMEVDARGDDYGVCYQSVSSSYMGWTYWFKVAACDYITNGWESFNGGYYYYENGQYIVSTSRTIDGVTYNFDSKGRSDKTPSDMSSKADSGSSSSSGSSDSSSSSNSSGSTGSQTSDKDLVYSNGSQGAEVSKIQKRLTELGYYTGEISGKFDDATEQAYRAFQQAAGLVVDGISGSDREVLYSDDAPEAPKQETTEPETTTPEVEETTAATEPTTEEAKNEFKVGDENDKVTEIQKQLAALGYFDIDPTGYFGDYTVQSVKNFQLANNLSVTGVVDEYTYNALYADDAVKNPYLAQEAASTSTQSDDAAVVSGPSEMPLTAEISDLIIENVQNQSYTDTASEVVKKTNVVTKKALSKSVDTVAPAVTTAQVTRSANVWLWLVLVVMILGSLTGLFFMRDRKTTRYQKYCAKKQKRMAKGKEVSSRW